jgi:iron(III) transport system permease protein
VGVAAPAPRGARTGGRWGAASVLAALVVAGPLLVLPLSFLRPSRAWSQIAPDLLPEALRNSVLLAAGVGTGTLLLGTALAVLVSFYDFPGRRTLEWALVLPLAMPAYVLAFVLLGQYGESGVLQRALRAVLGEGARLPDLRTPGGTVLVLTVVLYPYVFLLARAAFVGQSRRLLEVARSLGLSQPRAIVRVALPLARPALAAGTALAVMEALADFGAVNLLGYRALTDAIYRVWYGAFDRTAALQLGTVLLGLVLLLVGVERASRRRGGVAQATGRGDEVARRRLRGVRAAAALALPSLLLAAVVAGPVVQLVAWSVQAVGEGTFDASLAADARTSVLLAFLGAVACVGLALVVAYGLRLGATRPRVAGARAVAVGYAVPGSVAAAAVFLVFDRVGDRLGVVLTGTLAALLLAYVVRFTALALQAVEARMAAIPPALDAAARSLGAGRGRVLGEVHVPLLTPGVATAALLVFVEVLKELPATVLLRPFGLDTLAIAVWEATKESLYETAALPALLIVAVSLVPVVLLVRVVDRRAGDR